MIQVTPQMRILVAVEPADFRKGIDGLSWVCREALRQDPFSGYLFVFGNRSRKAGSSGWSWTAANWRRSWNVPRQP